MSNVTCQIDRRVVGTTDTVPTIAERYGVDEREVEDRLGEQGVEVCSGCGWWFHDVMRHPDVLCEDCADAERGQG